MDNARRYSNVTAAFGGLLGMVILPVAACLAGYGEARWLGILAYFGLCGGWILGATYIYPLFYNENGTARPHTARIGDGIHLVLCAFGRHHWVYDPSPVGGVVRPMECEYCRKIINEP